MVNSSIGQIEAMIGTAMSAVSKMNFGPQIDTRLNFQDLEISDDMLSRIVFSESDFDFVWGIHEWGSPNNRVGQ
jgi:hypothetical protein